MGAFTAHYLLSITAYMKYPRPLYALMKHIVRFALRLFYRHTHVSGLEHLSPDTPLLLTPNHQNAFMDAIVVACAIEQPMHSLTRASVFNKPAIANILKQLQMMPIYRIRNGIQSLAKNEAIFAHCVQLFQAHQTILIFPEGNHGIAKRLRRLTKGFSRIAFQAEADTNYQLGLKIVPVGLNYSDTAQARSDLYIRFGQPVSIADLLPLYQTEPQKAMAALRERIQKALAKEMVHISNEPFYETIDFLRRHHLSGDIFFKKSGKVDASTNFEQEQQFIHQLEILAEQQPDTMQVIHEQVSQFQKALSKAKVKAKLLFQKPPSTAEAIQLLLISPIYAYGWLNHYGAFKVPQLFAHRLFKDPCFHASIKLAVGLLSFPLFYCLQMLIAGLWSGSWGLVGLYFVSLLFSGWVVLKWDAEVERIWGHWLLKKKDKAGELFKMKKEIEDLVNVGIK